MKKYPRVGKYKVRNKEKYVGNLHECEHRSRWELIYMKYLDSNPNVIEWGSETVIIPYYHPIDKRTRRYFVDFYVKVVTKTGRAKKYIIEIKPYNQCFPPKKPKRQTVTYKNKIKTYVMNQAKWGAAKRYAEKRDWEFVVITEKELGIK
jgi:hypothetical protein